MSNAEFRMSNIREHYDEESNSEGTAGDSVHWKEHCGRPLGIGDPASQGLERQGSGEALQ